MEICLILDNLDTATKVWVTLVSKNIITKLVLLDIILVSFLDFSLPVKYVYLNAK